MRSCVHGLLRGRGATVVLVTHHTAWLRDCDEVLLLRPGGKLAKVMPGELSDELALSSAPTLADASAGGTPPEADERGQGGEGGKGKGKGKGIDGRGGDSEGRGGGGAAAEAGGTRGGGGGGGSDGNGNGGGGGGGGGSGRLVQREKLARGAVARSVWATYARSLGPVALLLLLGIYGLQQGLVVGSSWWLTQWAAGAPACGASSGVACYAAVYVGLSVGAALLIWVRLVRAAKYLLWLYLLWLYLPWLHLPWLYLLWLYLLWLYSPGAPRARGVRRDAREPQGARGRAPWCEWIARRLLRRDASGAHHQSLLLRSASGAPPTMATLTMATLTIATLIMATHSPRPHSPWLHTYHGSTHQVDVQLRASTQMLFMSAFAILGALTRTRTLTRARTRTRTF